VMKCKGLDEFVKKAAVLYSDAYKINNEILEIEEAKKASIPTPDPPNPVPVQTVVIERSISLPKFSGDPTCFVGYWSQVEHMRRKEKDKFEQCRLIVNSLEGRALRAVKHFEISAENVDVICDKLFHTFGEDYNRENELVGTILDLPLISESDEPSKFRDSTDRVHAVYLQLKALPTPVDLDANPNFWRPVLLRKLDLGLRHEFFGMTSDAQPKPSRIVNFLVNKATALDRAEASATTAATAAKESAKKSKKTADGSDGTAAALLSSKPQSKKSNKKNKKGSNASTGSSNQPTSSSSAASSSAQKQQSSSFVASEDCAFCDSRDHWSRKCPNLSKLSFDERWKKVKGIRCIQCLRSLHAQGESCPFPNVCDRCGGAHMRILCKKPKQQSSSSKN